MQLVAEGDGLVREARAAYRAAVEMDAREWAKAEVERREQVTREMYDHVQRVLHRVVDPANVIITEDDVQPYTRAATTVDGLLFELVVSSVPTGDRLFWRSPANHLHAIESLSDLGCALETEAQLARERTPTEAAALRR